MDTQINVLHSVAYIKTYLRLGIFDDAVFNVMSVILYNIVHALISKVNKLELYKVLKNVLDVTSTEPVLNLHVHVDTLKNFPLLITKF